MYIFKLSGKSEHINFIAVVNAKSEKQSSKVMTKYLRKHGIAGNFHLSGASIGYAHFGAKPSVILFANRDNTPKTSLPEGNKVLEVPQMFLITSIHDPVFGLDKRTQNILSKLHHIKTIADLVSCTKVDLSRMEHIGPARIEAIENCLNKYNLKLAE